MLLQTCAFFGYSEFGDFQCKLLMLSLRVITVNLSPVMTFGIGIISCIFNSMEAAYNVLFAGTQKLYFYL